MKLDIRYETLNETRQSRRVNKGNSEGRKKKKVMKNTTIEGMQFGTKAIVSRTGKV